MSQPCGCCEGVQKVTPVSTANRPGLSALVYRMGTHATFLETMEARLSSLYLGSYLFSLADLQDPTSLAARLKDAQDLVSKFLRAHFWPRTLQLLDQYDGSSVPSGALQTALVDELNRVLHRKSLYDQPRFAGVPLTDEIRELIQENPQGGELIRLNRLLLEAAYPREITKSQVFYPLRGLTTRTSDDPSIALLNSWATVADVISFYQERIANEGYLRTATERRSILELARLVGYALRPGVAASVYLAFTMENSHTGEIPVGTRAQSLPGPGELPQSFETSEKLAARAEWNNLQPRLTRPQTITCDDKPVSGAKNIDTLYFQGISTNLKVSDPLLIVCGDAEGQQFLRFIQAVNPQPAENRTKVTLQPPAATISLRVKGAPKLEDLLTPLSIPPSLQPANAAVLPRTVEQAFAKESDIAPRLLTVLRPAVAPLLYKAWAGIAPPPAEVQVYALRVKTSLFGHNALKEIQFDANGRPLPPGQWIEWPIIELPNEARPIGSPRIKPKARAVAGKRIKHEEPTVVHLDTSYEKILSGSWIVVDTSAVDPKTTNLISSPGVLFAKARKPNSSIARAEYGMSGKTTRIELALPADTSESQKWITAVLDSVVPKPEDFQIVRRTIVYAQSEKIELAEKPIDADIEGKTIELGRLYDGLDSGRWVIVSGERTDIPNVTGVTASELAMLAGVDQSTGAPPHTTLVLAKELAYEYDPDTVTIYGNVVKATHGETRAEVLGSGDGSKALQQFPLRQSPLTYLSAPTPAGAQSTLQVRVNDILWYEADNLAGMKPTDRDYITQIDDADKTTVVFGNGVHGARLPTGAENVKALYRSGIGKPGNVKARQISLLATRPLGVKSVINPLAATGGADRDSRDQARRNAPLAVMALDRLVSVRDYADFARTFAGIGKASAGRLSDGRRQIVHVTIAGAEDIPIDVNSDLYRNLTQALDQFGDPFEPIQVAIRKLKLLVISAKVRVLPDYQFESVAPKLRNALLDTFSFDRRELGQSAFLSEVISTMQAVEGVAYVDVETFDFVSEHITLDQLTKLADTLTRSDYVEADLARINPDPTADPRIFPAELAILSPSVPDTLILTELTG